MIILEPFNQDSPTQLSQLLFGGVLKTKEDQPVLDDQGNKIYIGSGPNKGRLKTRKVEVERKIKGLGLKPLKEWETKRKGIYQTNEEILKLILGLL